MSLRRQALVAWLFLVAQSNVGQFFELRDCRIFRKILSKVQTFSFSDNQQSQNPNDWKIHFIKLKDINQKLNSFLDKINKYPLPNQLAFTNLIQTAKGQSQEGLENLVHKIFLACIQSAKKQQFIPCIMSMDSALQSQLMEIIQENVTRQDNKQEQSQIQRMSQQIQKLREAYHLIYSQNQAIRQSFFEDNEKIRKIQRKCKQLQKQNYQLAKDLNEKIQIIKQQNENMTSYHSDDLVEELKNTILQKQKYINQQKRKYEDTIDSLRQQIGILKQNNIDLEQQYQRKNYIKQTKDDHTNCISMQKHKAKINEILAMSKQSTQKQMNVKLQNVKLQNINAQLQIKIKKLNQQNKKKQQQFLISKQDGSKLKLQFFTRIKDSLKVKLQSYRLKQNKSPQNNDIFSQQN